MKIHFSRSREKIRSRFSSSISRERDSYQWQKAKYKIENKKRNLKMISLRTRQVISTGVKEVG